MGVRPCEIELRKFMLLIGEQASGKSTIAKLIYFFQTLPDALYENALLSLAKGQTNFEFVKHINLIARDKFLETFGPTARADYFEVYFHYDDSSFLKIYQGKDRLTYAIFEDHFGQSVGEQIIKFFNAPRWSETERSDEIFLRQEFKRNLYSVFCRNNSDITYVIAERNTVVAYPSIFEEIVSSEIEKLVEDEVKEQDFEKRQRRGNEKLLMEFVKWSKGVRENFRNNGRTFRTAAIYLLNRDILYKLNQIAESILKGKYRSDDYGEQIELKESGLRISIKDASSGQQEVLRIIQGLFLAIGLRNRKEFLIVEEPEAHLFPIAQKHLINAFALFLNTIPEGKLIITTHSPYILACINILLMANFTSQQDGEVLRNRVNDKISADFWLNPENFNAYALGGKKYCVDIKDEATGLISQNYLDTISEQLGIEFSQLYDLLTQPAE